MSGFVHTKHDPVVERSVRWSIPVNRTDTAGVVPDLQTDSTHAGRPVIIRPERVTLTHRRIGTNPPEITVQVSGYRVKKDLTCGWTQAVKMWRGVAAVTAMPQWLAELVIGEITAEVLVHFPGPATDHPHGYHREPR